MVPLEQLALSRLGTAVLFSQRTLAVPALPERRPVLVAQEEQAAQAGMAPLVLMAATAPTRVAQAVVVAVRLAEQQALVLSALLVQTVITTTAAMAVSVV